MTRTQNLQGDECWQFDSLQFGDEHVLSAYPFGIDDLVQQVGFPEVFRVMSVNRYGLLLQSTARDWLVKARFEDVIAADTSTSISQRWLAKIGIGS